MSIDGIGKGAHPAPVANPSSDVSSALGVERPFGGAEVSNVGETRASDALGKLERGEISLDQYLDVRTADAVRHLEGTVSSERLAFVKSELRAQLESDPVLVELVRRATGIARFG